MRHLRSEIGLSDTSMADDAVMGLAQLAGNESEWVRRNVAEALGTLGVTSDRVVDTLAQMLADTDGQARFTSALSLARVGSAAAPAIPAGHMHSRTKIATSAPNAVDALNRIGTTEAQQVLVDYLLAARGARPPRRKVCFRYRGRAATEYTDCKD